MESAAAFDDDLLVEAARTGRLQADDADPLTRLLAQLRICSTGSCACVTRDECEVRGLRPDLRS